MTKNEKTALVVAALGGAVLYAVHKSKAAPPPIPSVTSASQLTAEGNALLVGPKVDVQATTSTVTQRVSDAIKALFGGLGGR